MITHHFASGFGRVHMEVSSEDLLLKSPSVITVAGSTSSGKTTFVKTLLRNPSMWEEDPQSILYCYSVYQPLYEELENALPNIRFHKNLPSEDDIKDFGDPLKHNIIVIDDLMNCATNSPVMLDLFCQFSHHLRLSVIYITQNIYHSGKCSRSLNLNSHYFILFKNKRDMQQISVLARQIFPHESGVLTESFEDATSLPFGYLLVDLHPASKSNIMLRSKIFPHDLGIVYLPRKFLK